MSEAENKRERKRHRRHRREEKREKEDQIDEAAKENGEDSVLEQTNHDENCFICLVKVHPNQSFAPCNCTLLVHRSCLEDWTVGGKRFCQICGLKYAVSRFKNRCPVCRDDCNEHLNVCKCKNLVMHRNCFIREFETGAVTCNYCKEQYRVRQSMSISCTSQRGKAFVQFVGKHKLNLLLLFFALLSTIVLISPANIFGFGGSLQLKYTVEKSGNSSPTSVLLFPGTSKDLFLLDIFYFVVIGMITIMTIVFVPMFNWKDLKRVISFSAWKRFLVFSCFPLGCLVLHFCGNIHYQFYCRFGVIPSQNCFWIFDWHTFLVALSGILIIALPLSLVLGCLAICFKPKRKVVVDVNE